MTGYKVFTHDLRPPVRGGDPVWDGALPHVLPAVPCSTGTEECGEGWNFSRLPETALRIAGLWPNGRPSRLFVVAAEAFVERGDKCRSASLTLVREFGESEIESAVAEMSRPFGDFAAELVREQMAWRAALARPRRDEAAVEEGLLEALRMRGLPWRPKRFDSIEAAWAARDAWDARDALTVHFVARNGWTNHDPLLLIVGLRDAYTSGLAIALPTGPDELGWAMEPA